MAVENKTQSQKAKNPVPKPVQPLPQAVELQSKLEPLPLLMQRATLDAASVSPEDADRLQHVIGNRAVGQLGSEQGGVTAVSTTQHSLQHMLTSQAQARGKQARIQPKLTLGPVGDKYEQEADAVAKQVVSNLGQQPPAQRQEEEDEMAQMQPLVQRHEEEELQMMSLPLLQRHDEEQMQMSPLAQRHEEELQMKLGENAQRQESTQGGEIAPDIESAIQNGRSGGQPLSDSIRQPMENAFNADFSSVRVHTDSNSDTINRSISARAFTTGQDIFFRSGEYNPGSSNGQELLAHELTHTVQQGAAPQKASIQAKKTGPRAGKQRTSQKQKISKNIQRKDHQSSLAKIINVGVNVTNSRGNLGQLGHAMDVWVEVDAGSHPVTPGNAKPNTVYGLEFEYWEYVDVPHDNQGATGVKPWNDIHGIKPDASTFETAAAGCDLTWKQAVAEAANGTLTGKKKIGFRDIPGLFEKPNRNVERTLKFRIVFFDGNERKEIFATQLLRVNNGKLGYSAYTDSLGNSVESHGFGGDDYDGGSDQEQLALGAEAGRLAMDGSGLPTNAAIKATLPLEAKAGVQGFVRDLVDDNAALFVDREMAEFVSKVDADKQEKQAPTDWVNMISKEFMTDKPGVAAGQYLIPNIPGTQRKQTTLSSGGLLVAIVTGNNILRMYYSDNTVQNVSMNIVPQLARKNWTINLRSFTEIPTKMIQNSLSIYKSTSVAATLKKAPLDAGSAHLKKFTMQGDNYIVQVGKSTGSRIKRGNEVFIFDPEIRDITGAWLKAQFGSKMGFIRASKIGGTKDAAQWNRQKQGKLSDIRPDESMEANDAEHLKGLAQTHVGNHLALLTNVLAYMRSFAGRVGAIEKVYNSEVPQLGLAVPNTLGDLAHNHFVSEFENRGNGSAVYRGLMQQFSEFQYLVKPAYRLVFGEDQLQQLLRQMRTDEFAAEVPNPDGLENQVDKLLFQLNGPYTLSDHVPATGIGKFDALYEPDTGQMKIIVKVNFEFVDYTDANYQLEGVAHNPLDPKYLQAQWDTAAKQPWIAEFKNQIDRIWNGKFSMHCIRPGWEDISATPEMEVREVPDGQQHFKVKVDKAALVNDQKMRTMGGSSYVDSEKGITQLREFDLVDKVSDPSVHAYLHAGEKKGSITPAYKLDRTRLEGMLAQFGKLVYQDGGTDLQNPRQLMNLIDAIKRTEIPSNLAHLHPIVIEKNMVGLPGQRPNWRLAALRAQVLEERLRAAGIRNPVQVSLGSENFNGLALNIAPPDPVVENLYVQNWSRISAAHEFGHMIGLVDEYNPAASTEMVKKMVSDGLLPPDTPGSHLSAKGANKASGQGAKQSAYASLLEDTGLSAPDFNPNESAPMSTSLMTGGYEVMAQHFVTFWEALTLMTATHVDKKYWEIR